MSPSNTRSSAAAKSANSCLVLVVQLCSVLLLFVGLSACDSAIPGAAAKPSSGTTGQSSSKAVTVTVQPDAPSVAAGSGIQLSANVSNTSKTAVVWSASAGQITSTGFFTAPTTTAANFITVTATSVSGSVSGSTTINITPAVAGLSVSTSDLPSGTVGMPYTATLAGVGGAQPYKWSVVSGALPSGLELEASTGEIAGSVSQSGTYPFSAQVSDITGRTAVQTFQLSILPQSSSSCGPPTYPCSRIDTALIPATAPPRLGRSPKYYGGHLGAGAVAVDPSYDNRILRVTDGNTDSSFIGESYMTASSAEKNVSSFDETMFLVHNNSGRICLFQFDAANFRSQFHGCYANLGKGADFGYTASDSHAFYSYYLQKLYRFVVNTSDWSITADPTFNNGLGYFDPDNPNCLNGQIAANKWYTGDSALSSDDDNVIVAIGPQQDANPYYVVWNRTRGCQWMNVQTWEVSQGWNTGLRNPRKISWASGNVPAAPGGIHNAQIDRSGIFGVLTIHGVSTLNHKLFWTIGTNLVDDTCASCHSHWACDFGVCFWQMGPNTGYSLVQQAIGNLNYTLDVNTAPVMQQWGNDEHMSHANAELGQKMIYLAAFQPGSGDSSVSQVWEDEILGVNWDGSLRTIRFNKSWTSGYGGFNGSARCSISRQGHYAICGSDYQMYNLDKGFGNGYNQDTCDHTKSAGVRNTTGCRTDVLLFELR